MINCCGLGGCGKLVLVTVEVKNQNWKVVDVGHEQNISIKWQKGQMTDASSDQVEEQQRVTEQSR